MSFSINRRLVRELTLQGLYSIAMTKDNPLKIFNDIQSRYSDSLDEDSIKFLEELLNKSIQNENWTRKLIKDRLENWDITRVALIDLLVLQMMITEMLFIKDVPPKVSISEGIEIVKKFSTDESSSFVNGILDSIFHSLEDLTIPSH
ncbi:MAG: transcription antitermination factor NusB [Candidatus Marinimicrobia bacterium]|nr:transcription antitermination factor NusB [Candidatus Neomarinimicrobiota bacterium]|tara:strand:- start:14055 stop:14495 length:441 start_codon:yes stop_codon:yes gene_type:complete